MSSDDTPAPRGEFRHEPVLLKEVVESFEALPERATIVDATLGAGGHSAALLDAHPQWTLIGIDRDPAALEIAAKRLERFEDRVRLIRGRHEELIEILDRNNESEVDGLLADLGVSSMQFDEAERGFSFRFDAPLDMRMSQEGATAADIVNESSEEDLIQILRDYGEEPMAKRIVRAIVEARGIEPITTTARLAEVIRSVKFPRWNKIDPSTLTFQALRIATNREIVELPDFLRAAVERTKKGGRVSIISFHSLEDRAVKQTFRSMEGRCTCPPRMPICRCGAVAIARVVTRHAIEATPEEVQRNPRSRSAKLRVVEKL